MAAQEGIRQGFRALSEGGLLLNKDFFSLDLAKISIWTMLIGGFVNSIYSYIGSQDIVKDIILQKQKKKLREVYL